MGQTETILYFGSFNPIHLGHTGMAAWALEHTGASELWLVVSPQNPIKDPDVLISAQDRISMARIAVGEAGLQGRADVCDVELSLPVPSYTIDTMNVLTSRYPDRRFSILLGADSASEIRRWRSWEELVDRFRFVVYPRDGYSAPDMFEVLDDAPEFDCSSTQIRAMLASGADCSGLVSPGVMEYILEHGLWGSCGIEAISARLERNPSAAEFLRRAQRYFAMQRFGDAINDFRQVLALEADNSVASGYLEMIDEILAFRNTDLYNP